jgi:hypothetical protein
MRTQIVEVSVHQTARVVALLSFFMSIPWVLLIMVPAFFKPDPPPTLLVVVMPVLYALVTYLMAWFAAWVYNLLAPRVGGIEVRLREMGEV